MDKLDIENLIAERLRAAVETTAAECVDELNQAGHAFAAHRHGILEWIDETTGEILSVTCGLGVGVEAADASRRVPDPAVDAFLTAALSGEDPLAEVLEGLEGDLANGGFSLLFVNKELEWVHQAIAGLRAVGARDTADLVEEALTLVEGRAEALAAYDGLMADLQGLDDRLEDLGDDIPALFLAHRGLAP